MNSSASTYDQIVPITQEIMAIFQVLSVSDSKADVLE